MKNLNFLISLFAIISMATVAGCEKDPQTQPDNPNNPVINITTESMEVAVEGGVYTIEYSISNPYPSVNAVVKCEAEWITLIETSNEIIKFSTKANTTDSARSAEIVIKYTETEKKITINQLSAEGNILAVEVENCTYNEFTAKIASSNPDMYYVHYSSEVDYFKDMNIDSEESLFYDDKTFFDSYATNYQQSIGDFMIAQGFAFKGNQSVVWSNLVPAKKYVAYAYGISFNADKSDYTVTTPLYYTTIETPINEIGEKDFTLEVEVSGADATYNITPNGYDGQYVVKVYDDSNKMYLGAGSDIDEAYTIAMAQEWMTTANALTNYYEMSLEDIYAGYTYSGVTTYDETLSANSNYMVAVYAVETVDGLPMMTSKPIIENFATGDVAASEMTFDIEFNHAYTRVVDFVVTPSTDEDYTILVTKSENLEGLTTDEEILSWVTTSYWLSVYNGQYSYNTSYLSPDSDYSILVFGYHGDVATTGLTRYDFRTEPEAESLCKVSEIKFNGPYDPLAIAELDPDYSSFAQYEGYFVMWFTTETNNADACITKCHYIYDTNTKDQWGDDGVFDDLTAYIYRDVEMSAGLFNTEYVIASVVQDYKGNYSDITYTEPFTYTESQLRDAQEFIDAVNGDTRSNIEIVLVGRDKVTSLPMRR